MTARSHLSLKGLWLACVDLTCAQKFHVDLSPAEAAALPKDMLYLLLEAVDPPLRTFTSKVWVDSDGERHRDYDPPAVVGDDGSYAWYRHGVRRTRFSGGPSWIRPDGAQLWHQHGALGRADDLPALIEPDGSRHWYLNGAHHREDDQPAVARPDGTRIWYLNGRIGRAGDLPALVQGDYREWYVDGQLHREDGKPAVITETGVQLWFDHGIIHRGGGSAIIHPTGETEDWHQGIRSRINRNGRTGSLTDYTYLQWTNTSLPNFK